MTCKFDTNCSRQANFRFDFPSQKDSRRDHDIKKETEFAILPKIIHQEWARVAVMEHNQLKVLKTQNLRDRMSVAELIFTSLAELSIRQIAETMAVTGMKENEVSGKKGGGIARRARVDLEEKTGRSVVTGDNFLPPGRKMISDE